MNPKPERTWPAVVGIVCCLLSAAGLYAGTSLTPVWWLVWIAPVPVLAYAHRAALLPAALATAVTLFASQLSLWPYLHGRLELPLPLILFVFGLPTVQFIFAALLSRALARRGRFTSSAFALPAAWVGMEYLSSVSSPHGTFGNIAYTQLEFLPVVQLAAVFGVWGIGFSVMLLPSALAVLLAWRPPSPVRWRMPAVVGVALGVALGYGAWRLQPSTEPAASTARAIGLAAADRPPRPFPLTEVAAQQAVNAYATHVEVLARDGARFAVLPETVVTATDAELGELGTRFDAIAKQHGMIVVVGIDHRGEGRRHNAAFAFGDGSTPVSYAKQHLIPGFESQYQPGGELVSRERDGMTWALAVCKDMDFPELARAYGTRGIDLLLVPAWDFTIDAWMHARMAVMRGVEGGFAIARSARHGLLTLSDNRGRVIAQARSDSAPVAGLVHSLRIEHERTIYTRFGDWFAWLSVVASAACAALAFKRGRQLGLA
jgi:apolipoprotein N-acyltransferase